MRKAGRFAVQKTSGVQQQQQQRDGSEGDDGDGPTADTTPSTTASPSASPPPPSAAADDGDGAPSEATGADADEEAAAAAAELAAAAAAGGGTGERFIRVARTGTDEPLGMVIDQRCVVTEVTPGGAAERAGIVPEMCILRVHGMLAEGLSHVKSCIANAGKTDINVVVSDPRLVAVVAEGLVVVTEGEYEDLGRECARLRAQARDAAKLEEKSAKALADVRKTHQQGVMYAEAKAAEVRKLKESIRKSKQAQKIVALDARVAEATGQRAEDTKNFKQTESALKISIMREHQEAKAYRVLLGHAAAEGDGAGGVGGDDATAAAAGGEPLSAETLRLSIELHQLEEGLVARRAAVEASRKRSEAGKALSESLTEALQQREAAVRTQLRTTRDLRDENECLVEEVQRLHDEVKRESVRCTETVKQMQEKLKAVEVDKERHMAQAKGMLHRVQGDEGAAGKRLRAVQKETAYCRETEKSLSKGFEDYGREQASLEAKLAAAKARVEELRTVTQRRAQAERAAAETAEGTLRLRRDIQRRFEGTSKLEAEKKRLTNLVQERRVFLASGASKAEELAAGLAEAAAALEQLEPVEAQVEALTAALAEVAESFRIEHGAAVSLAVDAEAGAAACRAEEAACEPERVRASRLRAQSQLGGEELGMREKELERLGREHAAALVDAEADAGIVRRKLAMQHRELKEQVLLAEEAATEAAGALSKLQTNFGAVELGIAFIFFSVFR